MIGFVAGCWILVATLHAWLARELGQLPAGAIVGGVLVVATGLPMIVMLQRGSEASRRRSGRAQAAVKEKAEDAVETAKETAESVGDFVEENVRKRPMAAIGVALAAGLVAGNPRLRRVATVIGAGLITRLIRF